MPTNSADCTLDYFVKRYFATMHHHGVQSIGNCSVFSWLVFEESDWEKMIIYVIDLPIDTMRIDVQFRQLTKRVFCEVNLVKRVRRTRFQSHMRATCEYRRRDWNWYGFKSEWRVECFCECFEWCNQFRFLILHWKIPYIVVIALNRCDSKNETKRLSNNRQSIYKNTNRYLSRSHEIAFCYCKSHSSIYIMQKSNKKCN